ncbi:hypothetical protein BLNAU_5251 [Blattamonas nauphoetae]|uniref:Uncharacterized protein n=1 Tax=Blattamonas nauphoetae TaxID=2049346 RepID=A0ABQ9Y7L7_9EUKA|nr:hypothetical protein BLNAU_5251 [Blattamonas nauphoetae]
MTALLSFGTKYLITEFEVSGSFFILDKDVTFSVPPEPPRITGASCSLNGKKDKLIVELSGSALSSSGQTAVMSGSSAIVSSNGELFNVSSTKCFVNFSVGLSENSTHVVFGGRYELLSVGSGPSSIIVTSGLFIDVPLPPQITSITAPTEISTWNFVLNFSGERLPSNKVYLVTLTHGDSFAVLFSSTIAGTSTLNIGRSGEPEYDTEYTISSILQGVSGKEDEHVVFSPATFRTPLGPTLSSVSCDLDSSNPDFVKLTFTTARIPSEVFTLTVTTTETPIESIELPISPSDLSAGFVFVEVYNNSNTLKYGTTYSIERMNSSSIVAVVSATSFSTPPEPIRITSVDCSLGGDKHKSAIVVLSGVKLGGGKTFTVTVERVACIPISGLYLI